MNNKSKNNNNEENIIRNKSLKKIIYLISPVRQITEHDKSNIIQFLQNKELNEKKGVYFPFEDNPFQNKDYICKIISYNKKMLQYSEEVCIFVNENSNGSYFDEGMLFQSNKKWTIINQSKYTCSSEITKLISYFADNSKEEPEDKIIKLKKTMENYRELIGKTKKPIKVFWEPTPEKYFQLGMIYYAEKYFEITNIDSIKPTIGKSFQNFLIEQTKKAKKTK